MKNVNENEKCKWKMNTSEGNHCHFWFWFIHVAVVTSCQTHLHHHQKRTNTKLKNTLDLLLSFFLNLLLTKSMISGTRSIFSTHVTFSKLLNHFCLSFLIWEIRIILPNRVLMKIMILICAKLLEEYLST